MENFRRTKPTTLSAQRIEAGRLSSSKQKKYLEQNDSQEATSLTMRKLKHSNHNSISNPQPLTDELKSKSKSSFTASFQRLLTTYKKSKDSHKSVSYGGGVNPNGDSQLFKSRNNIFSKTKITSYSRHENEREKKNQKSQKILGRKTTED